MAKNLTPTGGTDAAYSFPSETFQPQPKVARRLRLVQAQAKIESLLFLRHGEQQLLSLVIPLGLLIGLSLMPFVSGDEHTARVFPMVVAVALMGAGFTGQAIAVAFDRRYGALKRIGAAGVPTWALIAGKIVAVGIVVILQIIILTITAVILGWRAPLGGMAIATLFVIGGVAAFTAWGLLLGGTLGSEMVLALSNTIWFVLLGAAVFASFGSDLSDTTLHILSIVPSVALSHGLACAFDGSFNPTALLSLVVWAVIGAVLAKRHFRFTMPND